MTTLSILKVCRRNDRLFSTTVLICSSQCKGQVRFTLDHTVHDLLHMVWLLPSTIICTYKCFCACPCLIYIYIYISLSYALYHFSFWFLFRSLAYSRGFDLSSILPSQIFLLHFPFPKLPMKIFTILSQSSRQTYRKQLVCKCAASTT